MMCWIIFPLSTMIIKGTKNEIVSGCAVTYAHFLTAYNNAATKVCRQQTSMYVVTQKPAWVQRNTQTHASG
jgi:hypothetical protein